MDVDWRVKNSNNAQSILTTIIINNQVSCSGYQFSL